MEDIFFKSWETVLQIAIKTSMAYCFMIIILRVTGKRTLTKMNAFDAIVTFALGSILAAIALNPQVPIVDGLIAMSLLVLFQYLVTWASVRVKKVRKLITSSPQLLVFRGEYMEKALLNERITKEELNVAMRKEGLASVSEVEAAIMESNGNITVFPLSSKAKIHTLSDVEG
ncbi:DUF421 domain-containing protein [Echinicola pacifica]|uniref:DUF421 domain-containing protein n=1 Tax=Echinicola pacifica TaxID=346377 RepID=A0A918PXL8_9BACT|nr:YetF domain-containing protein [Echinicola pacifica]GGZ25550.1 DUF421 domain-containing protein [Echinicola pacifica]